MTTSEQARADGSRIVKCGLYGETAYPNDSYVVYHKAGGREAGSRDRITAHGVCIADRVADGSLVRVSGFAFEPAPSLD